MGRIHALQIAFVQYALVHQLRPLALAVLTGGAIVLLLALTIGTVWSRLDHAQAVPGAPAVAAVQSGTLQLAPAVPVIQTGPDCATASFVTGDIVGEGNPAQIYAAACGH